MGHFCYGVHRLLDIDTTYITLLRDPVRRLISLYYYSHSTPTAHYHKVARNMTLEEFLFRCQLLELDNGMTRLIAGDKDSLFINQTPFGQCDEALLEQAKANLDRDFSFVGIQEEFDKSVLLLAQVLGWKSCCYLTLNAGNRPATRGYRISDSVRSELAERNRLDCRLYAYCRDRFADAFSSRFPDPDRALEVFRNRNQRYQRWALPAFNCRQMLTRTIKKIW